MTGFRLEPLDTLFFRDGTPFTADSTPQDGVDSLFPPHPPTVAGAVRAALARVNGWDGHGRWPQSLCHVLGDGWEHPGTLSIDGPFVLYDEEPVFRAPQHLLGATGASGWRPRMLLRPGSATLCDLGNTVRLPEASPSIEEGASLTPSDGNWLTRAGMEAVLCGRCPDQNQVLASRVLWHEESRIGLERQQSTRTAAEGMLYSSTHVRLMQGRPGPRPADPLGDVSLGVRVSGIPESWNLPVGDLLPLGGESRLAECRGWSVDPALAVPRDDIVDSGRAVVIALSPLDFDGAIDENGLTLAIPGGGEVAIVCACLDRPLRIGGWDSLTRRPHPLRSVLAPGSVFFCEVAEPRRFLDAMTGDTGLPSLGRRQAFGFGAVALGIWPVESEET